MHMPGAMSGNMKITALMCLIVELVVIILGLDIFTNGFAVPRPKENRARVSDSRFLPFVRR
jgi:hypothetical protein